MPNGAWRVAVLGLALWGLACGPAKKEDPAPDPDVFTAATLDDAHVVGVVELGSALDCSVLTWCSSRQPFERLQVSVLDPWVGTGLFTHVLVPQVVLETLVTHFGNAPRVVLAGRVEAPDDPVAFADTCGMPPTESFAYPVDASAIWVVDDDGARVWELQCVLAVVASLDDTGRDSHGRTLREALAQRPGCFGNKSKAHAQAMESAARLPNRAASVTAENRCRRRDIPDAGILP